MFLTTEMRVTVNLSWKKKEFTYIHLVASGVNRLKGKKKLINFKVKIHQP